jgi:hypothetical protein
MDDDVRSVLDDIEELLPPRTTEYRSGALLAPPTSPEEPITEPLRLPPQIAIHGGSDRSPSVENAAI